jgi:hypothetical protein
MESTATSKAAIAGAILIMIAGFAAILYTARHGNEAVSIAGACLILSGLTLTALIQVKGWTTNTSDERRILAAAQREAIAERSRYITARAALEGEHNRLAQNMATERAQLTARLDTERKKMRDDFEGERATIMAEAFQTGAEMERAGLLKPGTPKQGNLIQFPRGLPDQQRERSREHGVVGP